MLSDIKVLSNKGELTQVEDVVFCVYHISSDVKVVRKYIGTV